eukprot:GHVT01062617.1.p1 GENE.GHVT01062617.1~~GHVT01062617.1.p1  ORF type:complete len:173 (-),score=39.91 GHVT01062617.1:128-646(-)
MAAADVSAAADHVAATVLARTPPTPVDQLAPRCQGLYDALKQDTELLLDGDQTRLTGTQQKLLKAIAQIREVKLATQTNLTKASELSERTRENKRTVKQLQLEEKELDRQLGELPTALSALELKKEKARKELSDIRSQYMVVKKQGVHQEDQWADECKSYQRAFGISYHLEG